MAKRNIVKIVEQEYQKMVDAGVPDKEIKAIQKERRKKVESEIYRYNGSGRVIEALQERIDREHEKLCAPGSPVLSDMPKGPHNPEKTTEKLAESIDKIIAWERRISEETGKNERFKRAWQQLDDIEMAILQFTYGIDNTEILPVEDIVEKVGYARSHVFRMKAMALNILAIGIFGSIASKHPFADT